MANPLTKVFDAIGTAWQRTGYRKWRKLRAGTLRRIGVLPPPGSNDGLARAQGPLIGSQVSGATCTGETIHESNLLPDPEVLEIWQRRLSARG